MTDETNFDVLAGRPHTPHGPSPDTDFDFSALDALSAQRAGEPHCCAINHAAHTSMVGEGGRAAPPEPGTIDPALYGWSGEWPSENDTQQYAKADTNPSRLPAYLLGGMGGAVIALLLALQSKPVVVSAPPVVVMPPNTTPAAATPKPTGSSDITLASETRDSDFVGSLVAKGVKIMDRPAVVRSGHTACSLLGSARQPSISEVANMLVSLYGWPRQTEIDIVTSAGSVYCPDLI